MDFIIGKQRLWAETEVFQFRVVNRTRNADQFDVVPAIYPGHPMYNDKAADANHKKSTTKAGKSKAVKKRSKLTVNMPIINGLVSFTSIVLYNEYKSDSLSSRPKTFHTWHIRHLWSFHRNQYLLFELKLQITAI